ncbi:exopolysaccharide biosynthesis polyprenyl glycosylphosphotransferase [Nonomuraea sp. NPDC050394]|uniref:exopolysaccharide biosynthesis polyprenyl glycosylphosphotransferase n=1 Tax=Nonomuraea sp. NPDC050394 TaxID=3364363 RepID=UPI0037B7E209
MTVAVGTSEPTEDFLDSGPAMAPEAPASPRPDIPLRDLTRRAAHLGLLTACLLAATSVTGWRLTNVAAAVAIAVVLHVLLPKARFTGWTVAALCTLSLEAWLCSPAPAPPSAAWLLAGLCHATLMTSAHGAGRAWRHVAARRRVPRKAVILSTGEHGVRLARTLLQHPEHGIEPIGLVGASASAHGPADDLPVLATYSTCAQMLRRSAVSVVILAGQPPISRAVLQEIRATGCRIMLAPGPDDLVQDFVAPGRQLQSFPLVDMRPPAQHRPYWIAKRVCDVTLSLLALLVLAPVLGLCLLGVRLEGGPGVLFRQRRVGMGGRCFDMLKIRTLKPASARDSATQWTVSQSRLSGPFGGFLRKTSLDELPQLWNVVTGDMSIVGPRPERPYFVQQFSKTVERYDRRHRVPVGITGWAQVHGLRGDTSIEERARLDNHYIDTWSFGLDVKIALKTIGCVLRLGGA